MYRNNDIDYLKFVADKEIVIFGAGRQGTGVYASLRRAVEKIKIIAFCDNDDKIQNTILMGDVRVISFERLCEINSPNNIIIICSRKENEIRQQLFSQKIYNFISASQIDFGGGESYYDEQYFEWQKNMGMFGGRVSARRFQPYITEGSIVVELGSGGGYLLKNLKAKEKIGIEINDIARKNAEEIGIKSVKYVDDISDEYADVIISTHVLEHVENPLGILRQLRSKLKEGGKIIFYVPNESCDTEYTRSDINNHLYTWNCLTLGNLFKAAGYFVHSVWKVQEKWPDNYLVVEREVSPELFDAMCNINGEAAEQNNCMIVACK